MKVKLEIEFDNEDAARHFGLWLCESGEQQYWEWMEYREAEDDGDITAILFHYHNPVDDAYPDNDPRHYAKSKFLNNYKISTTCGRITE